MGQKSLSESEEMYLVTVRTLCESCTDTPVSVSEIAKELGVQPVSAHQMINKLAEDQYLIYTPYKGVELTSEGREISTRILRHRRLWEVFFVQKLNLEPAEADKLACHFEHHTSPDVAVRLSQFLENPTVSFHGKPIPQPDVENGGLLEAISLEELNIGQSSPVMRVDASDPVKNFLKDQGIRPGERITVTAIGNMGDRLVESSGNYLHLSAKLAKSVLVSPIMKDPFSEKEPEKNIPLSKLKAGEKGVIKEMNFEGAFRKRLLAMGLGVGETIQVKRIAPLGDPVDFIIKGYELSLRKSEAGKILVKRAASSAADQEIL